MDGVHADWRSGWFGGEVYGDVSNFCSSVDYEAGFAKVGMVKELTIEGPIWIREVRVVVGGGGGGQIFVVGFCSKIFAGWISQLPSPAGVKNAKSAVLCFV